MPEFAAILVDGALGSELVRSHGLGLWLFCRGLGAVFLIAFVSLWSQLDGLFGQRGILPVRDYLARVAERRGGPDPFRVPTLFWLDARDGFLHLACASGVVGSVLVLVGIAPALALLLLWALYLSFASAGQVFLSYQWDVLLLEAAVLGAVVAPWNLLPGPATPPPDLGLLLLWWLLFRLMFQSGVGKLSSGDESWRDLTALRYHWFTQPLPTPMAWYAEKLPDAIQRLLTAGAHLVEIGVPLLIFGPPELRWAAAALIAGFQLLIMATGNYNFFNLLTVALCLPLVADAAWISLLPEPALQGLAALGAPVSVPGLQVELPGAGIGAADPVRAAGTALVAVLWLAGSLPHLWRTLRPRAELPRPVARLLGRLQPFRTINTYGLFRVMTRERPEIVVEGSRDGERWREYEFRWKPGDPGRAPPVVQPHQPRLDWQMWFAALGRYQTTPWFRRFEARLLEGARPVLGLLADAPFPPDDPPRYLRARLYRYRFTGPTERRETGQWWVRREAGSYGPVVERPER